MNETGLKIKLFGDSALRVKAKKLLRVTEKHRQILSEMARLMYDSSGIGLAAPQVGLDECFVVVDVGSGLYKLINPKIIKKQGRQVLEEGCLSFPNICIKINRAKRVLIEAQDEFAKPIKIEAEGLLACVFQHEIDHLKGKLIIDYASIFDKLKIKRKLEELKRMRDNEELPEPKTKSCQLQL